MAKVGAGTPRTGIDPATGRAVKTLYTVEQYEKLQTMKDPTYSLGVARAEFAGKSLLPDGSIVSDHNGMRAAMTARAKEAVTAAQKASSAAGSAKVADAATAGQAAADAWVTAGLAQRRVQEVDDAITQGRFVFVCDQDLAPIIYYQAAVAHNADIRELKIKKHPKTAPSADATDEG